MMLRKYNRAFILTNPEAISDIMDIVQNDDNLYYWLFDSKESFHGEHDDEFFYFKDNRIPKDSKLPLKYVQLEYSEYEIDNTNSRDVAKLIVDTIL